MISLPGQCGKRASTRPRESRQDNARAGIVEDGAVGHMLNPFCLAASYARGLLACAVLLYISA